MQCRGEYGGVGKELMGLLWGCGFGTERMECRCTRERILRQDVISAFVAMSRGECGMQLILGKDRKHGISTCLQCYRMAFDGISYLS